MAATKQLLVVEDDSLMRRSLRVNLEQTGYNVNVAASGEQALESIRSQRPDLVLLDIGLPGMDGLETLRAMRRHHPGLPVIFLTARRRELDEIVGLELGADDYITKPFDMDVLLAHIKAVLRRAGNHDQAQSSGEEIRVGDLRILPAAREVYVADQAVALSPKEFDLLVALARHPGRVFSMDELLTQVWGAEWIGETQTIYVHVRWLRQKIEEDPANPTRLRTVRGVGYKLVPAE